MSPPEVPFIERDDLEARLDARGADAATRRIALALRADGLGPFDLGPGAAALCEQAAAEVEPRFAGGLRRVQDAWRRAPAVRALATRPALLEALETAYGRRPFAFQTLSFRQGSEQDVHVDTLHFHSDPPGFMCGVWIALEDVRPEAGPLVYHPGSHRLPYPEDPRAGLAGLDERAAMARLAAETATRGLPRREALPRAGEAVVWAANLVHGGGAIADPASTRRSLVVHYFFEGCTYWTPLHSRFDPVRKSVRLPTDVATDRWVWPRERDGRRSAVPPRAVLGWARRTLLRLSPAA